MASAPSERECPGARSAVASAPVFSGAAGWGRAGDKLSPPENAGGHAEAKEKLGPRESRGRLGVGRREGKAEKTRQLQRSAQAETRGALFDLLSPHLAPLALEIRSLSLAPPHQPSARPSAPSSQRWAYPQPRERQWRRDLHAGPSPLRAQVGEPPNLAH